MILALELTAAFLAGGVTSIAAAGWYAKRKLRAMMKPKPFSNSGELYRKKLEESARHAS